MLEKTVVALRRADRSGAVALALTCLFVAGAAAVVPSTDRSSPSPKSVSMALLPLNLEPASSVDAITDPSLLVVHTAPIDISPLLDRLVLEKMLAEQRCLAEAMYYEARGEGVEGEKAIAEVVFHRMKSRLYPHSICGVVYERASPGRGCQFSFTCNGEMQLARRSGAWAGAKRLAANILGGLVRLGNETEDAVSFHAVDVEPGWGDGLVRTIQIGNHVFYRAAQRTASSS
jgi:hypothetical protein